MCGHKRFEGILEDVLEDVFGLTPRPQIGGHDGPGAASHPTGIPKAGMGMGGVLVETWIMGMGGRFKTGSGHKLKQKTRFVFMEGVTVHSHSPSVGSPPKKTHTHKKRKRVRFDPSCESNPNCS